MRKLASIIAERAHLDADDRDLRSRTDAKEERVATEEALTALAKDLVDTKGAWLEKLGLDERLHDAIKDAQKIKSPIAKNRQMRVVRRELREAADWQLIRKGLTALATHGTVGTPRAASKPAREWVQRLLSEGATGLEALLSAFPDADRTHFRQLLRSVEKAPAPRRAQAEQKLEAALASLLATGTSTP